MEIKKILSNAFGMLPPALQHLSGCYNKVHAFYSEAQWWSREKIEAWQLQRLQSLVQYAYDNTEGYHQLFDESKVKPSDIRSLDDITLLPFTTKELLRENIESFTASETKSGRLYRKSTGGSTGIPFSFYADRKNTPAEYAFMYNAWETIGWNESDIGIKLRGARLGDSEHLMEKIGYHRYALSSNFMTEENYENYMLLIEESKASFIHVYPSTLTDLSHLILNHHEEGRLQIKHIFLGSENLYEWQKEIIHQAFPYAKLMSWYGHSERAIWGPWCDKEECYHLNPFYGYCELLNGDQAVEEGEVGELVGTAFWMFGTLFIRYRTNDFAQKGPDHCEKCGRQFQLLNHIDGRMTEIIVGKTGRRISLTVFAGSIMHGKTFEHIKQFRFVQKEEGVVVLAVIPTNDFSNEDMKHLEDSLKDFLKEDFSFKIETVDSLSKAKNGKFSYLEQHLKVERADNLKY